jgi:hypothetical protein
MSWPKQWEMFDFSMVLDDPIHREWREAQSSQVLLLQGRNHLRSGYHWLSAVPLKYIQSYEQEGGNKHLFAFLHPDPYLTADLHVPQPTITSLLIWQFLEQFPEVSEDSSFFEDVQTRIDWHDWADEDCFEQYRLFADLFSRRPVAQVIIDRLDSCTYPDDTFVQNLLSLCGKVTGL